MALDWKAAVRALVGIPALSPEKPAYGKSLDDSEIESARRRMGGQLATLPVTTTRFYLEDWESAILTADGGDLTAAGALWSACRGDGVFAGVLSTREGGVVNLPKQFRGPDEYRKVLEPSDDDATSIFDAMMPLSELELIAGDGDGMGVGVGELCPVSGRDYPVLTRHDPALLRYVWTEDRWYFRSVAGLLPISPGDGRWVLHIPGGRIAPWKNGFWRAVTKSYILKTHAESYKANWEAKLANAARAAYSPIGASEDQRTRFLDKVIAWGLNTVFQLPPGWDVKLIEGKGEGHVSYEATIERSDHEFMIQVAGQVVTTTGGTGFVNGDMSQRIEDVLIQKTAKALAYTINTQILPRFLVTRWGVEALRKPLVMSYVVPTKDLAGAAAALTATGGAIKVLGDALLPYGKGLDVNEIGTRFGVPFDAAYEPPAVERVALQLAPTDIAKVVTTDEARASQGLGPIGDERGDLTVSELEAQATGGDDEGDGEGGEGGGDEGDGGEDDGGGDGEGGDSGGEVATDDGINDVEADYGIGASGPDAKTDSAVREKHFEATVFRFHAGRWEYLNAAGNWDEDKHPRKKGEFAPKGGGDSGAKDKPGKEKVPAKKATPAQKKKAADVHKKATAKHREAHSAHKKAAAEHSTAKKKLYAAEVAVTKTKTAVEKAAEAKKNAKTPAQKAKAAARHKAAVAAHKAAAVKHRAAVAAHKVAERKRKVAEKKAAAAKAAAEKAKAKRDAATGKQTAKRKSEPEKRDDAHEKEFQEKEQKRIAQEIENMRNDAERAKAIQDEQMEAVSPLARAKEAKEIIRRTADKPARKALVAALSHVDERIAVGASAHDALPAASHAIASDFGVMVPTTTSVVASKETEEARGAAGWDGIIDLRVDQHAVLKKELADLKHNLPIPILGAVAALTHEHFHMGSPMRGFSGRGSSDAYNGVGTVIEEAAVETLTVEALRPYHRESDMVLLAEKRDPPDFKAKGGYTTSGGYQKYVEGVVNAMAPHYDNDHAKAHAAMVEAFKLMWNNKPLRPIRSPEGMVDHLVKHTGLPESNRAALKKQLMTLKPSYWGFT